MHLARTGYTLLLVAALAVALTRPEVPVPALLVVAAGAVGRLLVALRALGALGALGALPAPGVLRPPGPGARRRPGGRPPTTRP